MPIESTRALIVLGRADLLTGGPALGDTDVITIAHLSVQSAGQPPNTVILRRDHPGPLALTVWTADGPRTAEPPPDSRTMLDVLWPSHGLQEAIDRLVPGARKGTLVPLLYALCTPTSCGVDLHAYSPVERGTEDICLLRLTNEPLNAADVNDLAWVAAALRLHAQHAPSLNSYQCAWRKAFPGQELEHKYTLPPGTSIWDLAADALGILQDSDLPGFVLKYHDALQTWDYLNYLYDIRSPEPERGYVSFIPAVTHEGWRMKRKWFTTDAFARREQLTDVSGTTNLDAYVRDTLGLEALRLPTFRRIRYDVNIESLATGHYYGIFFDRCHLTAQPTVVMCQCEIEYCRSRTTQPPTEATILAEIDQVADWVETLLARHRISSERSHYSKLSFLRQSVHDHPELLTRSQPIFMIGDEA